jgi:hypothetical protein
VTERHDLVEAFALFERLNDKFPNLKDLHSYMLGGAEGFCERLTRRECGRDAPLLDASHSLFEPAPAWPGA